MPGVGRQARCENERLLQEVERFKARLAGATRDYVSVRRRPCHRRLAPPGRP